jgi:hypothetical protein
MVMMIIDLHLKRVLTTQQHVNTIANPHAAPAVPTTHVNRMNNITPKMFWMHGRKQPISVPRKKYIKHWWFSLSCHTCRSFVQLPIWADGWGGLASPSVGAAGMVFE